VVCIILIAGDNVSGSMNKLRVYYLEYQNWCLFWGLVIGRICKPLEKWQEH